MFGQQVGGMIAAIGDAAIGVVEDNEVPSRPDIASAILNDRSQQCHRLESGWIHPSADVANHRGFARHKSEYGTGIDAGIGAAEDNRLPRRHDF
jgi:hypothetical protein